eukprot:4533900-Pleurochrysis_carterae.AAC.3
MQRKYAAGTSAQLMLAQQLAQGGAKHTTKPGEEHTVRRSLHRRLKAYGRGAGDIQKSSHFPSIQAEKQGTQLGTRIN